MKCPSVSESLKIPGNFTAGNVIYHLQPTLNNEIFVHHLIDNDHLPFVIRNNSLLAVLDGYHKRENYSLRIKSKREIFTSPTLPEPSCISFLNISIQPSNRNPPKLIQQHYIVHVRE